MKKYITLHPERSVCHIMSNMKENIINHAFGLFLNQSYEAVSISDISKAIGVTKGALYHYFLNKEELFKAVIDKYLIITGLNAVEEDITLKDYIQKVINHTKVLMHNLFNNDFAYVPINYMSLLTDAFRHYPGFARDKEGIYSIEVERSTAVLIHAVKKGEIRQDIDCKTMAMNLFSITLGTAANLFCNNSPEAAIKILQSQMDEFYNVLKP